MHNNSNLKRLYAMIREVAPMLRMSQDEYKNSLWHKCGIQGSSKDLSSTAFAVLFSAINADKAQFSKKPSQLASQPKDPDCDRMRKKILSIGYQMGYDRPRSVEQQALPKQTVNFLNIDGWCKSAKSPVGKSLNEMSKAELAKTLTVWQKVYYSYVQKVNKKQDEKI